MATHENLSKQKSKSVDSVIQQIDTPLMHSSTIQQRKDAKVQDNMQTIANEHSNRSKTAQLQETATHSPVDSVQLKENKTGLPDQVKSGVESLSGISLDDVKVHYNSPKPAQLQAHAYAQGTDIHVAPKQEQHIAHEAWHVVQQKQGRVKPTKQLKESVAINDNQALEKEADVMGAKAMQMVNTDKPKIPEKGHKQGKNATQRKVVQARFYEWNPDGATEDERYIWHRGPVIGALWEKKTQGDHQEMHNEFGVWIRKGTQAHLSQLLQSNHQVSTVMGQATSAMALLGDRIGTREQIVDNLRLAHETAKLYVDELGLALKKFAGISIIGIGLSVGAAAVAAHFLSLPGVPIAVKAAIDIAGVLYGAYVSYRWMKTDLLPVFARCVLAGGNMAIWASTIYSLLSEGLNGSWFSTVHIAALPFAITIEIIMRKLMKRVETMMLERETQRGGSYGSSGHSDLKQEV